MENNSPLFSITPLDGRYQKQISELSGFVSEYALIKYRVEIEIKYLLALSEINIIRKLSKREKTYLISIYQELNTKEALKIKTYEDKLRHDVKAVEKYLREAFIKTSLKDVTEFIHFGLTTDDINNIAYRLTIKNALEKVILPTIENVYLEILIKAKNYKNIIILGRTHGQAAVPTTFGKEFMVFARRLEKEIILLKKQELSGKLNGAIGSYNALYFAYPKINWLQFSKKFVKSFDLTPNLITTQIAPYEDVVAVLQNLQRINGILLDFDQDMWRYISDSWLKLAVKKDEVGSSTMPQKVNPIDFENSEGNLTLANGLMQAMIDKLYVSRLQRDLSNSTVIRNIGTVLGFSLLAYKSTLTGISRIDINLEQINKDLNEDWSILAEGLQTYLRKEKFTDAYFYVAQYTKGKKFNQKSWLEMISSLPIRAKHKKELLKLTPQNYKGIF